VPPRQTPAPFEGQGTGQRSAQRRFRGVGMPLSSSAAMRPYSATALHRPRELPPSVVLGFYCLLPNAHACSGKVRRLPGTAHDKLAEPEELPVSRTAPVYLVMSLPSSPKK